MSDMIEILRGRTLLIEGEWPDGEAFTDNTSLSVTLTRQDLEIQVQVAKTGVRSFQIYASNTDTSGWAVGLYDATLNRVDASFFQNGDDYVHGPEKFSIKVV